MLVPSFVPGHRSFSSLARRRAAASLGVACLVAAVGCGGPAPGSGGTGGIDSGSGGAATGGATASGGAPSGSGGSASGGSAETSDSIGTIQIFRTLAIGTSPGRMTATFDLVEQDAWDALSGPRDCTREEYGECTVTTRAPNPEPEPEPEPPFLERLHAGTIQIAPDRDDFSGTGTPDGENNEYTFATAGELLGDEIMTITASGGLVSAFQGTIHVPLAPLLTSPAVTGEDGAPYPILVPRDADFSISWDARGTGQTLTTAVSGTGASSINCRFDAAGGTGTFPAPALQQLSAGGQIHLLSTQRETISTPKGDLVVLAGFELDSMDRTVYPYFVLE